MAVLDPQSSPGGSTISNQYLARDQIDQGTERHRLGQVRVHSHPVRVFDVALVRGGGQHDDGDMLEAGVALEFLQRLAAVLLGHFQVQQDEIGQGGGAGRGVRAAAVQIIQQFLAVADDAEVVVAAVLDQGLAHQQAVVGIVVGHEDDA
jgi:hypothetical protein